jgi:hypothetical protein
MLCNNGSRLGQAAPSRLIDVGVADDFSDVRLYLTDQAAFDALYLALSHCWGKTPVVTLRTECLAAFEQRIPFETLSTTFKHAIIATRQLRKYFGVHFIWIDSLCIIQDSLLDWQQESKKMGQIYSDAFCVIAATGGTDGGSGLFYDRNPLSIFPVILQAN